MEDRTLLSISWSELGPAPIVSGQIAGGGPVSGRVTGIAADPNNANIIYIASAGGGIWKTTNGGSSWAPLTDNLTDSSGNPLPEFMGAVAETDATSGQFSGNQIVYSGMGEADNSGDSFYGDGILVSTNGGTSWTLTNAGGALTGKAISKIAIDPSDPTGGTAYAAVSDFAVNGNTGNTGIWKTTNFGQTWTNLTGADGLSTFYPWSDVAIDPHTPSTLYAAEGSPGGSPGDGVYKSTDGGTTWTLLTNCPNGTQDGRIELAVYDDGTTDELFVSITSPSTSGLYKMEKSTDGGNTFTDITSNVLAASNYLGGQGWYDTTLGVDPSDPNFVYAAGDMSSQGPTFAGSPVESFDGGNTWRTISTDKNGNGPHTDSHGLAFDANGNVLEGNDGGIFRLNNPTSAANQTWSDLNTNLDITQFTGVAADPTNSSIVYGGSQDNGTEKYTGSLGWNLVYGGDGGITRVDPLNHNIVYQEYVYVALSISTNGGASFNLITSGIAANTVNFYAPYVLDGSGNIYYGTDYLNFSSDQGATWSQIGTPGVNGFNPISPSGTTYAIDAIAVKQTGTSNVVYVSAGGLMFVTENAQAGGLNVRWTQINLPNGYAARSSNSIVVDPSDPTGGTAYAVVSRFTGGPNHVFKTTNFGASWTDISGNLPDTPVDSVTVSPNGKYVYVGTDVGVYFTSNVNGSSTSWSVFGTGLPHAQVVEVDDVTSLNMILVGTHGRGAWEIPAYSQPLVTSNPTNQKQIEGQTATFTAAATGNPAPTVQWQVSTDGGTTWNNLSDGTLSDGTSVSGSNSNALTLSNLASDLNGDKYRAVFTNLVGSAATSAATLTVLYAPIVSSDPSSQKVTAGQTATFTAAATGNPSPNVQWQVSTDNGTTWTNMAGAASLTLNVSGVLALLNGNEYRAVFTNTIGSTATTAATLTVLPASAVTSAGSVTAAYSPNNQTIKLNATVTDTTLPSLTVNEGTVTFTVTDSGGKTVGTAKGVVNDGLVSANFPLSGGLLAGSYTLAVHYSDSTGGNFQDGGDFDSKLSILAANLSTTANNITAYYSPNQQTVTLTAALKDLSIPADSNAINEGTVTFTLLNGSSFLTSGTGTVTGGTAFTTVTLAAGQPLGSYTVTVSYSDSKNTNGVYNYSDAGDTNGTLTIGPAQVAVTAAPETLTYSTAAQDLNLSATVTDTSHPSDLVGEGIVTFTIEYKNNNTVTVIGNAQATVQPGTTSGGTASTTLTNWWTGGRPAGDYIILVSYADASGKYTDNGTSDQSASLNVEAANVAVAAGSPSPPLIASSAAQNVTLTANVTDTSFPNDIVNEGTVTFMVMNGTSTIGQTVSGSVSNGVASAVFSVPSKTAVGSYTIMASYADSQNANGVYNFNSGTTTAATAGTLSIQPANVSTTASNVSAVYSPNGQSLQLKASVANLSVPANTVGEGIVTFTLTDKNGKQIGNSVTSSVTGGTATATLNLTAAQAVPGTYTIGVSYSDSAGNFTDDGDNGAALTITPAQVTTTAVKYTTAYSPNTQTATLTATVTDASNANDTVGEGIVTFTVSNGTTSLGSVQGPVLDGKATVQLTLPAGAALGSYTTTVSYSDSSGNFTDSGDTGATFSVTPADVTTKANAVNAVYSPNTQTLALTATVTDTSISTDTVDEGVVTFTVASGPTVLGSVQGNVSGGTANANFTLPAGQAAGSYTITVNYSDTTSHFFDAGDTGATLTITPANVTTKANAVNAAYSPNIQTLALTATVTDASNSNDTVSHGSVTFTVTDNSGATIGSTTGLVSGGKANASLSWPAGQALGNYNIAVSYSDSSNDFTDSGDTKATLTVAPANVATTANNVSAIYSANSQTLKLSANLTDASVPSDIVSEGSVTFTIQSGSTALGSVQGAVVNGTADALFTLPAGLSAGSYAVTVSYGDSQGFFADGGDTNGTLTVAPVSVTTTAASASTAFSTSGQTLDFSAAVADPGPTNNVVNEGVVTFTLLSGSTVIGSVQGTVASGSAHAAITLPGGLAAGNYTLAVGFSDSSGNFADKGDNNATLAVGVAATNAQLIQAQFSPNYTNLTVTETVTAHIASSTLVDRGTVTFTLSGQTITTNVDGNGNATIVVNLPMLTLLNPQSITASYTDADHNLASSTDTETASWQVSSPLLPSYASFSSNSVTMDLFGLLFTFTNGALTQISYGSIQVDFIYNGGLLAGVSVDGMDLVP